MGWGRGGRKGEWVYIYIIIIITTTTIERENVKQHFSVGTDL